MIMSKRPTLGKVPAGRIAVLDHKGNVRGAVTPASTQLNVSRFGVGRNAKLVTVAGRKEWHGQPPKKTK
jgi:hypothetical protein